MLLHPQVAHRVGWVDFGPHAHPHLAVVLLEPRRLPEIMG